MTTSHHRGRTRLLFVLAATVFAMLFVTAAFAQDSADPCYPVDAPGCEENDDTEVAADVQVRQPAPDAAPAADEVASTGLAATGASSTTLFVVALAALATGGAAVMVTRRRGAATTE